ncbi:MAG: hypothetical protein ACOYIK_06360 [Coriobacteriales bacterium]
MKKLALVLFSVMMVFGLAACGSNNSGTFTQPGTQTSSNENGLIFNLNLAQFSENINYVSSEIGADIPTISSLDIWADLSSGTDSASQAYTYKITNFDNAEATPMFIAGVYNDNSLIREVRVTWADSSATSGQDTFRSYCVAEVMAVTGLDEDTAGRMYDTAATAKYTEGQSDTLTYAYSGNVRCYYMISSGYHVFVVEPFSDTVRSTDEASGNITYVEVKSSTSDSTSASTDSGTSTSSSDSSTTSTSTDGSTDSSSSSDTSTSSDTTATTDTSTSSDSTSTTSSTDTSTSSDSTSSTDSSGNVQVTTQS